jgi:hypothetical protein
VAGEYGTWGFGRAKVPQFYRVIAYGAREDVLRSRMPENLAEPARSTINAPYFPRMWSN